MRVCMADSKFGSRRKGGCIFTLKRVLCFFLKVLTLGFF